MICKYKTVLASASPRRQEILNKIGLEFDVWPSNADEIIPEGALPFDICVDLSKQKAMDVASQIKQYNETHPEITSPGDILVIGADTIVVHEENDAFRILGKPKDDDDAFKMLSLLADDTHKVYTGVTFVFLFANGKAGEYSFYDVTDVTFYPISDDEILEYVKTGEPLDKAGAYGIQGSFLKHIKNINGDFYNVMGLPASRMYQELRQIGAVTVQ